MSTGSGKTFSSLFLIRYLLKKNLVDKAIIAASVSATVPFLGDLEKVGYNIKLVETVEEFKEVLNSKSKIIVIKHSLISEIGLCEEHIKYFRKTLTNNYQKLLLILDEAHALNNYESIIHGAYQNIYFMWDRIVAMTATPWSSKLEVQILGMMCLVKSEKYYKNLRSSKKEFKEKYVIEKDIYDWKGKYLRSEVIEYINIDKLRKELEEFSYFYYPKINLNFEEFLIELEDYEEYDTIIGESLESTAKKTKKKNNGKDKP